MMRTALIFWVVASAFYLLPTPLEAQVKDRWRLTWKNEKPEIHTHQLPSGDRVNYWYVVYEVSNPTDQIVPILLDVMLYTETGKDLQHNVRKIDRGTVKSVEADPKRAQEFLFGRYYPNVIVPQNVEYKIIEKHAHLSNRSQGIIAESIENFKAGDKNGNRWYLNPRELRHVRVIHPGQTLQGVAIFRNVNRRARTIEVHVSGLIDIIRIEQVEEFETKMHYENNILRLLYSFPGDEYEIERDPIFFVRKDWIKRRIGPVASKETLEKLMDEMLAAYQQAKKWNDSEMSAEDIQKEREKYPIHKFDLDLMARVFRLAMGRDFGYDESKDLMGNEKAIWRMHEWWVTNQSRLIYNFGLNRFEIQSKELPGEVDRDE